MDVSTVPVQELHRRFGFSKPIEYPETSLYKPLTAWKMEIDDSPIFRYLYKNFRPHRHLEFGTWEGTGVLYCLEECDATVWTINLLEGELTPAGKWIYYKRPSLFDRIPFWNRKRKLMGLRPVYQTDSLGFIGRYYMREGMGHRVCQIYSDSRQWDISNYPSDFFDSVLVDGGHAQAIVESDTRKGLSLLRPGGLMMWHDFCLDQEVSRTCTSTYGVINAVSGNWTWLSNEMKDIFWIKPSWILVGVKK